MMNDPRYGIFALLLLVGTLLLFAIPTVSASVSQTSPDVNSSSHAMGVGVYVNSIDNLDLIKGTYTLDFYLHFHWLDNTITTSEFELMNGHPSAEPLSVKTISRNAQGPVKDEWYRVRADFDIIPDVRNYPFESGVVAIKIEDADDNSTELTYVPLIAESGIDPEFSLPGWNIGTPDYSVSDHRYPWGESYSTLDISIPVAKNPMDSLLQTIIPPLIFCFIAGLSFFIKVEHAELVHLRYVLTTSMFISAVMYHFSQISLLPMLGVLKIFDKFMIGVYLFMAMTVIITTLCYLALHQWEKPEYVKPINDYGAIVSVLLSVFVFFLLLNIS
jgi:hypothetical protein